MIIGNGIAGITAARHIRKKSDFEIFVISSESPHFFSRTALMYVYMGHMRFQDIKPYEDHFWSKNRIQLIHDRVTQVDFIKKEIVFNNSADSLSYDKLIIASGSKSNMFSWPGIHLDGVNGLYHMQDLEQMEKYTPGLNSAVIVGGGLIGIEMAEMFHSRHIPVTMLVREESYWSNVLPREESQMINCEITDHGIDLLLQSELREILGNENGKVKGILTSNDKLISCGFVGITTGVSPNIEFLKNGPLEMAKGILVNQYLQTNINDVYAIGDCAQIRQPKVGRRPIEAVWYTGRIMGEVAAYNICEKYIEYDPGIWFNSAKFFDIEYQVYGEVPAKLPDYMDTLYWEHANRKKSVRIVFEKATEQVLGFNLMGIRFRQEVCERWIREKTNLGTVIKNLKDANFDPEFSKNFTKEIHEMYHQNKMNSV